MESTDFLYSFFREIRVIRAEKIIKCISTPLKDSAMRTELSMLNLCRMQPVFTLGDKYSENMQYKRLYFLLFVDGFGGFGKNQQRYGSHQTYSRKVIPDVMRIGAGSFPSFPGCK